MVVGFQSGRVCIFDHLGNVNIDSVCFFLFIFLKKFF